VAGGWNGDDTACGRDRQRRRRPKRARSPGRLAENTTTTASRISSQDHGLEPAWLQALITPWLNHASASTDDQNASRGRALRQASSAMASARGGAVNTRWLASQWRSS